MVLANEKQACEEAQRLDVLSEVDRWAADAQVQHLVLGICRVMEPQSVVVMPLEDKLHQGTLDHRMFQ